MKVTIDYTPVVPFCGKLTVAERTEKIFDSVKHAQRFLNRNPQHRYHGATGSVKGKSRGKFTSLVYPPAPTFHWCSEHSYRVHNALGGTMCCTLQAPCGELGHIALTEDEQAA